MENKDFITFTNADIYKKLEESIKVQTEILDHAKYTNGKIAQAMEDIEHLRNKSIGIWIAEHPFKFTLICFVLLSFITPDTREVIINTAKNFL